MRLTIKTRLFTWFLVVSVIPLLLIGGISYYFISSEISRQTEEKVTSVNNGIKNMVDTQQKVLSLWLDSAAASFSYKLSSLGESNFDYGKMVDLAGHRMPTWYIGKQVITNDHTLVDELIGEENLQATIFMLHKNEFVRVSTNVRKNDGSRIVGTLINSGPVYNKIINGQQFHGRANVEGIWQATIYKPILDKEGKLIGAFVLGRREKEYEMIDAIKKISIGESGYVFITDSNGNAIIHPYMNGQNIMDYPWVKEIIKNKEGKIRYDFNGQKKIAYYTYYEPWDWYIITGGNEHELFSTRDKLYKIILFALLTVIGVALFIAYVLSRSFSKPIMELMGVMKETQDGDLSGKLNYVYNDEFGVLNNTFNNMLSNISILVGRILFNSDNLKEASKRLKLDITQSADALKGIENGVESLSNYKQLTLVEDSNKVSSINIREYYIECMLQWINELRLEIENIIINQQYEELENLKLQLSEVENVVLNCGQEDDTDSEEELVNQSISYEDRIDNLKVEVEKLKLLLNNISSSGDILDDIALELDNQVNIFKIDDVKKSQ
ncbi:Cache 3/Cache 2 fusion domain-containing protein [Clostridium sp. JNZ J1-5]